MDRIIINASQATSEPIGEQLQTQPIQEMGELITNNTRQVDEVTQSGIAAMSETIRILIQGQDAAKAACDAKAQRIEALLQAALESITTDLKHTKTQFMDAKTRWEEEKSELERRCKKFKDKLALITAAMEKRLAQAEQREAEDRTEKKELWNLNEDLIARNRRIEEEALASNEQWRRQYSTALAQKIDLLHQCAVSYEELQTYSQSVCAYLLSCLLSCQPNPIFPIEVFVNIAGFAAGANDYAAVSAMCATSHALDFRYTRYVPSEICFVTDLTESPDLLSWTIATTKALRNAGRLFFQTFEQSSPRNLQPYQRPTVWKGHLHARPGSTFCAI
jgi:hypothetical protein